MSEIQRIQQRNQTERTGGTAWREEWEYRERGTIERNTPTASLFHGWRKVKSGVERDTNEATKEEGKKKKENTEVG